ncbi:EAL domain-containing protein [Teredinibacter waterburyi]|uniref:EAL domain-containing protein n=1 Tax=Teredinibacter waterburyi TaxID=1500538 RepID=UPI00165FE92A|nr:EAL domain-containing protein [Teredinibacter waterburyi]
MLNLIDFNKKNVGRLVTVFTLLIGLGLACQAYALSRGKINAHPLYIEADLGSDFSYGVIRDASGYLWIATDNGLKRYDGYNLKSFTSDPNDDTSIGANVVIALLIDKNDNLWAAGKSLSQYHPETETFTSYNLTDGATIWGLTLGDDGVIWFGGEGFGLRGFDVATEKLIIPKFPHDRAHFISAIAPHKNSSAIWVASNAGLFLFDTETSELQEFSLPIEFVGWDSIRDMRESSEGDLWMATDFGILVMDAETQKVKHYRADGNPGSLATNFLWSVFEDSKGRMWAGTDKMGVHRYRPETDDFLHIAPSVADEFSFPPGSVNDIYEDEEGTVWFAVAHFGIRRISEHLEKFISFKHSEKEADSLGFDNLLDLLEDRLGNIWIATDGGGLDKLDPTTGKFTHYRHDPNNPQSISSNSVLSLAEDKDGYIWVGTWVGGLNRLDPQTGIFEHIVRDPTLPHSKTLANNNIFRVVVTDKGTLMLSMWRKGLQIYDPVSKTFEAYFPGDTGNESGIANFSINEILPAGDNRYWVGGHSGLELFDLKAKTFTEIDLPHVEGIFNMFEDAEQTLWIATSKGLIRYRVDTGEKRFFTVADGLADNFVTSVEPDNDGNLWLGTRAGLNRFNPNTLVFDTYGERDGLASSKFNRFSHLRTRDGDMFFGGADGLSYFSPSHLPKNTVAPQVHLTDFELFQTPVQARTSPYLDRNIDYAKQLKLPHSQRDITFEFTALNYVSPIKNRYRYRLQGLEDDWIEVDSSRRRIRYTNLAPGNYTFEVLGSNNDYVWGAESKKLQLTILPPWWQTWWARLLFVIAAVLCIYLFSFWRFRLNRIRERELQRLVNEKTAELENANNHVNQLNYELEHRVEKRTKELSVEVEERRLAEAKLFHMAFHDALTGLPNRSWLLQHIEQLLRESEETGSRFAVFFMDGDRFKQVNDTHGHVFGDRLLVTASQRLNTLMKDGIHAARLGGDEFTIVIDEIESEAQVIALATEIVATFDEPFVLDQTQMFFRVSIGMVISEPQYTKPDQLLRDADIAMYRAKARGRGLFQLFDSHMREQTLALAEMEADLYMALAMDQFSVVFQPIIELASGELNGYEVLIRWHHPEKGMIPPDKFIPVAEDLGLIFDIGLWVLQQACRQLNVWRAEFPASRMPSISVNLSPLQLRQPDLIDRFDSVLEEFGVSGDELKLEITESALMENTDNVNQLLGALRERQIELAIDDFGTGYSSLSYLDQLPVQVLKIDRRFVDALIDQDDDAGGAQEIVRATISLAHNLKVKVVAEGIETQAQMDALCSYNCDYGQGFFIAHPLSPGDATDYLRRSLAAPKKTI